MTDTLDAHAFAAACEAAPDVDPEAVRRAVDAYLTELHATVTVMAMARKHDDPDGTESSR